MTALLPRGVGRRVLPQPLRRRATPRSGRPKATSALGRLRALRCLWPISNQVWLKPDAWPQEDVQVVRREMMTSSWAPPAAHSARILSKTMTPSAMRVPPTVTTSSRDVAPGGRPRRPRLRCGLARRGHDKGTTWLPKQRAEARKNMLRKPPMPLRKAPTRNNATSQKTPHHRIQGDGAAKRTLLADATAARWPSISMAVFLSTCMDF